MSRVERAAGGNPLLIEELTAWLSEGGASAPAELPTNVKTMIAARLDRLPAPERQLILSASVIGDVFWQGSLEALGTPGPLAGAAALAGSARPDPPHARVAHRGRPGAGLQARPDPRGRLLDAADGRAAPAPRCRGAFHRGGGGRPLGLRHDPRAPLAARRRRASRLPTTCSPPPTRPAAAGRSTRLIRSVQPGARADPRGRRSPPPPGAATPRASRCRRCITPNSTSARRRSVEVVRRDVAADLVDVADAVSAEQVGVLADAARCSARSRRSRTSAARPRP